MESMHKTRISLALGARRSLSRQTAWGCLTSNLVLPGSGSLVAGNGWGYAQLALALGGIVVSSIFGVQFIVWQLANWSRFHSIDADPMELLTEMWLHLRWTLFGVGIFFLAWIWALISGLAILRAARADGNAPVAR